MPARPVSTLSEIHARWLLVLLLGIHTFLLAWCAFADSPTVDEPFHLAGGIRRLQMGRFDVDRGNPPLVGTLAALPILGMQPKTDWDPIPNSFAVGRKFMNINGSRSFWMITVGRWVCVPISLIGCVLCYRWAADLYGTGAALIATALWCFCPNMIGHGHLLTSDLAATTFFFAATYFFWKWLAMPSLARSIPVGLVLGIAQLTKFVCLLVYPICIAIWIVWRLSEWRDVRASVFFRELAELGLIVALSVNVINLAYLGSGSFERLDSYRVGQRLLGIPALPDAMSAAGAPSVTQQWLGSFPVPLPYDYVKGADEIHEHYTQGPSESYLRGEWKEGRWWFFYVYGLLIKLPLGTMGLVALAGVMTWSSTRFAAGWKNEIALLFPIAVVLIFVTFTTSPQRHVRYVLPVLPFLYVWTGKLALLFRRSRPVFQGSLLLGIAASIASSLAVFPHSLAYFNELVGGPRNGHSHLIDSNIDWGQDVRYLKKWLQRHPQVTPLHLSYHGIVDPKLIGIQYLPVAKARGPLGEDLDLPPDKLGPQPGWHAICVQQMRSRPYDYFLHFEPIALTGYSFYLFHIDCDDANRIRDELGIPPLRCDSIVGPGDPDRRQ